MDTPVLSSTLLLTLLMLVGLVFFIRASIKDRTEVVTLRSEQSQPVLAQQLQQHFTNRSYQVVSVNDAGNAAVLTGMVQPSLFLAVFLSGLAGVGCICLGLVLGMVWPAGASLIWVVPGCAPLAGWFYWRGAQRLETVQLQVAASEYVPDGSIVTVTAHRDEVAELVRSLALQPLHERPATH